MTDYERLMLKLAGAAVGFLYIAVVNVVVAADPSIHRDVMRLLDDVRDMTRENGK